MENRQDFVIENGVLTQYNGPGGAVTIPAGVRSIAREAFHGREDLKSVVIPKGVRSIGNDVFGCCVNLESVAIPAGVTRIGFRAFDDCFSLQSADIPAGVTVIATGAFRNCGALRSVTIPEGVAVIEMEAFYGCESLESVTIPESVTEIGWKAFRGCLGLADGQGLVIVRGVLYDYAGPGGAVDIPAGVAVIGDDAFQECRTLERVTIPEGTAKIGSHAFECCRNLKSVTIPESVTEIGDFAFYGCYGLADEQGLVIVRGVLYDYTCAYDDTLHALVGPRTAVDIPEGVTVIGHMAFARCGNLESVTIPESVARIGLESFKDCPRLNCVTILPGGVKIWRNIFENSRPVLIAPRIPISDFEWEDRPGAACGFARLYLEGAALDGTIREDYLTYIRSQRRQLFPPAVRHEELLRVMLAEKMLVREDIGPLLEECGRQNNFAAKAAVMDYAGRSLEPVDPVKALRL